MIWEYSVICSVDPTPCYIFASEDHLFHSVSNIKDASVFRNSAECRALDLVLERVRETLGGQYVVGYVARSVLGANPAHSVDEEAILRDEYYNPSCS